MSTGPTQNYADPDLGRRRARPALALTVRAVIAVGPLLLALVVGAVAALVVPPGRIGLPVWLWLVGVVATTSGVLFVCSRLLRRLAPLSALLRLSLVLPDDVPHRFALARRRWSPQALEDSADAVDEPSQRLLALVATLAAHDARTRAHAERVQAYAALIGRELGLPEDDVERLSWAALLHDVGKVHVAPEIINKAGKPSDEEWAQLQSHPHHGGELVEPLRAWLGDWLDGVEQHHERFDGKGYPRHLAGQDISLAARIIAVADTYDVITSARSYKKPMTAEQARAEITRCAGEQFDPVVVRALLSVGIAKLRRIAGPATLLALLPVAIAAPAQAAPSVGAVLQAAGGHAATAVLAAGVGVTGGVASADALTAPPGARVAVVQVTSTANDASTDAAPHPRTGPGARGTTGDQARDDEAADSAAAVLEQAVPSAAPTSLASGEPSASALSAPPTSTPAAGVGPSSSASIASGSSRPGAAASPSVTPATPAKTSRSAAAAPVPSTPSSAGARSSGTAGDSAGGAAKKAAQDAQQAAEKAAKDQADTAKAAQDAADKAAKQAAKDAQQAAEKAAKDQADAAKAAQDAADKAAKQAAKEAADAAKAAADAARRAADAAGKLTSGLTGGRTGTSSTVTTGSSGASPAPSTGSSGGGGLISRLVDGSP